MAKGILAGEPLLRNDILKIVHIFEQSFDHYLNPNSPYFKEYLQALKTLVGLGFTAVLADGNLLYAYKVYLAKFLVLEEEHLNDYKKINKNLAYYTAEMIHIASICFYTLNFPRYYQDFIEALSFTLKIPEQGDQNEAKDILNRLVV